jgi:hypothetical protein
MSARAIHAVPENTLGIPDLRATTAAHPNSKSADRHSIAAPSHDKSLRVLA